MRGCRACVGHGSAALAQPPHQRLHKHRPSSTARAAQSPRGADPARLLASHRRPCARLTSTTGASFAVASRRARVCRGTRAAAPRAEHGSGGAAGVASEAAQQEVGSLLKMGAAAVVILLLGVGAANLFASAGGSLSSTQRAASALLLASGVAVYGLRRRSLDASGARAALLVGAVTIYTGAMHAAVLLGFFVASSALTKYKSAVKRRLEEDFKEGGQRNYVQVLANGGVPTLLCAAALAVPQPERLATALAGAFVAYYACCCGDTWASELGVLSRGEPRLVTSWQLVPRGTNGGISLLGTGASCCGGAFVGALAWATALGCGPAQVATPLTVVLGAFWGLLGSFIDSILGATVQYSGYCSERKKVVSQPGPTTKRVSGFALLNNHAVNFVSATLTAAVGAAMAYAML